MRDKIDIPPLGKINTTLDKEEVLSHFPGHIQAELRKLLAKNLPEGIINIHITYTSNEKTYSTILSINTVHKDFSPEQVLLIQIQRFWNVISKLPLGATITKISNEIL